MKPATQAAGRRYARALLDVALQQGADGATLRAELEAWARLVAQPGEAREALTSPAVPAEKRRQLAAALAESAQATPLLRRLLALLADRGRLEALPQIATAYVDLWNAQRGVVAAEVITAAALAAGDREALAGALAARTGAQVELTTRVEPDIVGGVVVRMGGRTYDGSVRTRLDSLRAHLTGAG